MFLSTEIWSRIEKLNWTLQNYHMMVGKLTNKLPNAPQQILMTIQSKGNWDQAMQIAIAQTMADVTQIVLQ